MTNHVFLIGRLKDRRASLERILDRKREIGEPTDTIEELIRLNGEEIELAEAGNKPHVLSRETEAMVNAHFFRINGL